MKLSARNRSHIVKSFSLYSLSYRTCARPQNYICIIYIFFFDKSVANNKQPQTTRSEYFFVLRKNKFNKDYTRICCVICIVYIQKYEYINKTMYTNIDQIVNHNFIPANSLYKTIYILYECMYVPLCRISFSIHTKNHKFSRHIFIRRRYLTKLLRILCDERARSAYKDDLIV